MAKRTPVGRSINGVVFGLRTPDRHKNSKGISDFLKDVAPTKGKGTLQITSHKAQGRKIESIIVDDLPSEVHPLHQRMLEQHIVRKKD